MSNESTRRADVISVKRKPSVGLLHASPAVLIAVTLSAAFFTCSEGLGAEDLVAKTFSVGDAAFSITLPKEAKIEALPSGGVRIDFTPRATRTPGTMELSAATAQEAIAAADTMRIEDRAVVAYRSEVSSGGSGGDEGILLGTIRLAGTILHVECHVQDEWSVRAQWCLDYLRSLRVTP